MTSTRILLIVATLFLLTILILVIALCVPGRTQPSKESGLQKFGTLLQPAPRFGESREGVSSIPPRYDLRTVHSGLLVDPLDQGTCESCWAFAITTAVSDAVRIAYSNGTAQEPRSQYLMEKSDYRGPDSNLDNPSINTISPYYFSACTTGETGQAACMQTNNFENAFASMARRNFYVSTNCRVHDGEFGQYDCEDASRTTSCIKYNIGSYGSIPSEEEIQQSLLRGIPVVTGIGVYSSFLDYWRRGAAGVYSGPGSGDTSIGGHAVVIVGWDTATDGTPYWIVRNSWGPVSGNTGHFWMLRGGDVTGIESNAHTFTLAAPQIPSVA